MLIYPQIHYQGIYFSKFSRGHADPLASPCQLCILIELWTIRGPTSFLQPCQIQNLLLESLVTGLYRDTEFILVFCSYVIQLTMLMSQWYKTFWTVHTVQLLHSYIDGVLKIATLLYPIAGNQLQPKTSLRLYQCIHQL